MHSPGGHNRSLARPSRSAAACRRARSGGFTLIELLLVVVILLVITAISIPVIGPSLEGRHIREASRQVNSYFAVARDTALRNGRPVGVMIQRFSSELPE